MRFLVSACLLGLNCRYDGGNNYNVILRDFITCHVMNIEHPAFEELDKYLPGAEWIPVCPEQLGGLPTPRCPAERCWKRVVTKDGQDVTEQFRRGAEATLELAKMYQVVAAVFKARSPSCGCGEIYDGTFTKTLKPGDGVTTELLKRNNIAVYTEENFIPKVFFEELYKKLFPFLEE